MNINLEPAAMSALKVLSERERRSPDDIINDLILAKSGVDPQLVAALDAQAAQFRATGEVYDWDEVEEWMLSWFTDNEKPEPQCRSLKSTL